MEHQLDVTRDVDLELSDDDLWRLVGDGAAWAEWLADSSDVDVVPGGEGDVVDDGEHRHVQVDEVEPGRRVGYRWWPVADPSAVSTVELLILPRGRGSTLRITEHRPMAAMRWEVRALALWSAAPAAVCA